MPSCQNLIKYDRMRLFFCILSLLCLGCTQSTYQVSEPLPTLEVTLLQSSAVIDEPIYLRINASQGGYGGSFRLSTTLNEGQCDITLNDEKVSGSGEWIGMREASQVMTLIPRKIGHLRLMLEVMTQEGLHSSRHVINLNIAASSALILELEVPESHSITTPVEITLTASKAGYSGTLTIKFDQQANTGKLQYGSVGVLSGETFAAPTNNPQTLYYTAAARGTHRLQFAATDGYTTEYKIIEFIIMN